MSTIVPQTELVKKAAQFVREELEAGKKLSASLEEACMRFNLSPKDAEMLADFFKDHKGD